MGVHDREGVHGTCEGLPFQDAGCLRIAYCPAGKNDRFQSHLRAVFTKRAA
ncbi:hypothetical protein [Thermomonas sp.]|uniref:hypothetical protein n=1 Tax=Thermomonas sp. TaxID=1971895 RepID=UPI00248700DF|nr:hypothetical protein [Thermomonas sp.]MDI1253104.1 hypothetical protein [Thermomonas sp.]